MGVTDYNTIVFDFKHTGTEKTIDAFNREKAAAIGLSKVTDTQTITTKRLDEKTGKYSETVRTKLTPTIKRFKFEFLGIMFAGMAIERAFKGITQAGMDMYGMGELINDAYGLTMLPVMDLLGDSMLGVIDTILNMSDEQKMAIGGAMLLGQAFGGVLSAVGQLVLFSSSLQQMGGFAGFFGELNKIFTSLGQYAGKSFDTIITFSSKLGSSIVGFFSSAGSWLLGKATTAVDMIQGKIDGMVTWLFGNGTMASTAKVLISIGVAFIVLDLATRFLNWAFTELGTMVGGETTLGRVMLFVGATLKGGYIDAIAKAFFTEEYAVGKQAVFNAIIKLTLAPLTALPNAIQNLLNGRPLDAFINIAGGITGPVSVFGDVIGGLKKMFGLASGGIVTKPTFAMIGESGPEAVIPLNNMSSVASTYYISPTINIDAKVSSDFDSRKLAEYIDEALYNRYRVIA
jgi:hypothetical protein